MAQASHLELVTVTRSRVHQRAGIHRGHPESESRCSGFRGDFDRRGPRSGACAGRAMICQLAAFHSPTDVQVIVVTSAATQLEWASGGRIAAPQPPGGTAAASGG